MSKIKNEMNQIDKNEAGEINIADKVFLKYVKNTIEDFIRSNQLEMVENLIPIYRDKKLNLWNIKYLVELLLTREENLDSLVLQQDKKIYNLLNNELTTALKQQLSGLTGLLTKVDSTLQTEDNNLNLLLQLEDVLISLKQIVK